MYGNVNTLAAFELAVGDEIDLTANTAAHVDFTLNGLKRNTDVVTGVMFLNPVADIDILPAIGVTIPEDNILRLVFLASANAVISAGAKFRGVVSRCDNNFNSDLL